MDKLAYEAASEQHNVKGYWQSPVDCPMIPRQKVQLHIGDESFDNKVDKQFNHHINGPRAEYYIKS